MAYLPVSAATIGSTIEIEIRGRRFPAAAETYALRVNAARQPRVARPLQPALEHALDAWQAGHLGLGGRHDRLLEQLGRASQRGELQRLLRPEMGEQPALGQPHLVSERLEVQAVQALQAGRFDGRLENHLPGREALAHAPRIARPVSYSRQGVRAGRRAR